MAEKAPQIPTEEILKTLIREKISAGLDERQATDVARAQLAHDAKLLRDAAAEKPAPKS
jgi:hypothetical protein